MAKATSIKEALARVEKESGVSVTQAEKVDLTAQVPSIEKMDASLGVLKACRHLSLSTNNVDRIAGLTGMASLEILSLGRNQVKKLEGFDGISETLQQLWISYNLLEKMAGIERLPNLRVLLASNNKVRDWSEVDRLSLNTKLEELLLMGNPLTPATSTPEYRVEVLKRLPGLKKLDGLPIGAEEKDVAMASRA